MKKIYFLSLLLIGLVACDKKVETEYHDVPALRASKIFQGDSVYRYLEKYKDANKSMADSYLKRSKEAENNDLSMAIYFCKRAITLYPELGSYKMLAGLIERTGDFNELNELYTLISNGNYVKDEAHPDGENVYIFGMPDEDTYYEYMVSEILARNYLYGGFVYTARDNGYDVPKLKERLFSDKRLNIDMTTPDAKNMMLLFLSDEELAAYNKLESTFKEMLSSIKDVSPVFEINKDNVNDFDYNDFNGMGDNYEMEGPTLSYVFVNYLKEKREKPDEWYRYNYKHVIDISDSVKAVIYAIDTSETACPVEMRHIYHRLVTYNQKAEIISSQIVAMQSGEQLLTMSYNMNKFTVTGHRRKWKHPYDRRDFDNYLTGIEKIKEASYEIRPDGTIREVTVVAAAQ
jgi:hypothetical protein